MPPALDPDANCGNEEQSRLSGVSQVREAKDSRIIRATPRAREHTISPSSHTCKPMIRFGHIPGNGSISRRKYNALPGKICVNTVFGIQLSRCTASLRRERFIHLRKFHPYGSSRKYTTAVSLRRLHSYAVDPISDTFSDTSKTFRAIEVTI
jgi:hypothetical protein